MGMWIARDESAIPSARRAALEADPRVGTVAAALLRAGRLPGNGAPDGGIILLDSRGDERRISYPELVAAALTTASGMRERGVIRGDRILLLLPTSEEYLITLAAALLIGVVPCTVATPTSRAGMSDALRYLDAICDRLDPALLVAPANLAGALRDHSLLSARRIATPEELAQAAPLALDALPALDAAEPAHLQLTSGSTDRPKGVVLTHRNALANIRAIASAIDFDPGADITLSWLPLYHDMGLVQLLINIYYGATIRLMTPTSFLRDPLAWLRNISRHRVSMAAAPTFAYSLCARRFDPAKLAGLDLRSWRRAFIGAEPVPRNVVEEFRRCFAPYGLPDHALYPCYGMAETVLATTLPIDSGPQPNRLFGFVVNDRIDAAILRDESRALPALPGDARPVRDILGMGRATQGLEVAIRGADGRDLTDRAVGEICVRGESLAREYFRDPEATAAAFRDGWYRTGDLGYLADGELYVLGRTKELIIVRGRNFQPHDIEAVIERHQAVRQGYTVSFGVYNAAHGTEEVVAIAETRADPETHPAIVRAVQESLQATFGFVARDILLVPHGANPRTTSGKRQRLLAREWYGRGRFQGNGNTEQVQ